MDGLKISVNKNEEEKKPAKKRGRPKKAIKKTSPKTSESKSSKTSVVKARANSKAGQKAKEQKSSKKSKGGFMSTLIVVVITGVLVGGAIYTWQSRNGEKDINDLHRQAKETRESFEQRLSQLKNKLTGIETENQKLKDSAKKLEERVKLLDGAKKDFSNQDLGISFEYPAIFGETNIKTIDGLSGKKIEITFSENEKLVLGGVTTDFKPKASSTKINFLESQGYYVKKHKFYFQPLGASESTDYEIVPTKEVKIGDESVLVVDKNSFVNSEEEDKTKQEIDIGENIGAIANLKSENFKGITFLNKDLGMMPLESFETLLASIKFSKQSK